MNRVMGSPPLCHRANIPERSSEVFMVPDWLVPCSLLPPLVATAQGGANGRGAQEDQACDHPTSEVAVLYPCIGPVSIDFFANVSACFRVRRFSFGNICSRCDAHRVLVAYEKALLNPSGFSSRQLCRALADPNPKDRLPHLPPKSSLPKATTLGTQLFLLQQLPCY